MASLYSVLSPALQAAVVLDINFIAQNVSDSTMQCHFDDGWGPSASDPAGIEGLQDCLLDRFNLCSKSIATDSEMQLQRKAKGLGVATDWSWFDFTACTFRNQKETDTLTDSGKAFHLTMKFCADVTGQDFDKLSSCANGKQGFDLFSASHAVERKDNTNRDAKGHDHPLWLIINGKASLEPTSWKKDICDAIPNKSGGVFAACK